MSSTIRRKCNGTELCGRLRTRDFTGMLRTSFCHCAIRSKVCAQLSIYAMCEGRRGLGHVSGYSGSRTSSGDAMNLEWSLMKSFRAILANGLAVGLAAALFVVWAACLVSGVARAQAPTDMQATAASQ